MKLYKIHVFAPGKANHLHPMDGAPSFVSQDNCIKYMKALGDVYYTLYDIDDQETFLFYIPLINNVKYIIKACDIAEDENDIGF